MTILSLPSKSCGKVKAFFSRFLPFTCGKSGVFDE
jgi:hypothetical protein